MGNDHDWYKDAIVYELHVRAFFDSDGDGVGDFRGLLRKLDYLQDLGVTAVWLLPFYPSPLKDDGYDIADYTTIHPTYGTVRDFRALLKEVHRRGLRVITELVLNHTSDQHPWFRRARSARPGSRERDFYVWSDTLERYRDARIIFTDAERSNWTWDEDAGAYYWHRFFHHQPDLNFDSPDVQRAVLKVVDFWLRMGVDGLRLDAVPYLFEREGTSCENLPETHAFLKALRGHVDERFAGRMLLAEANQWPEDAVEYFGAGDGDECHMAFHFPVMPRLFMALQMEDRYPIVDILEQTPPIPRNGQWALFLRNHDELTLEMVTDEFRDYMYRVYARDPQSRINLGIRRRLAPLLNNSRRRMELMNGLLLSLPGTPIIYYGDEIGMGDNIYLGDRNGVRTPMQWSADRNAGFSRSNPQQLYLPIIIDPEYHYEAVNVDTQQNNPQSFLWWMKRLIALRKRHRALGRGALRLVGATNHRVLAFVREHEDERVLVVANLSRYVQHAELDLSAFRGLTPVEMFGGSALPTVDGRPFGITVGPHAFYWFALRRAGADVVAAPAVPALAVERSWRELLDPAGDDRLEGALATYIASRPWYQGRAKRLTSATLVDCVPVSRHRDAPAIALVEVRYSEGIPELYVVPLALATERRARTMAARAPHAVVATVEIGAPGAGTRQRGVLYDAAEDDQFVEAVLDGVARRRRWRGARGGITALRTLAPREMPDVGEPRVRPAEDPAEGTNTVLAVGRELVVKLLRRVESGVHCEVELGRYFDERTQFTNTPALVGALEYRRGRTESMTLAVVHRYVPHERDAWQYALDTLGRYFERLLIERPKANSRRWRSSGNGDAGGGDLLARARELAGPFVDSVELLGRRTAEMHLALASDAADARFAPEPFTPFVRRALYQSLRGHLGEVLRELRRVLPRLPEGARAGARAVLSRRAALLRRLRAPLAHEISGLRLRVHGDYHLGQVLHTGKDFVIIDFGGESTRSLEQRRFKHSPLRDVAGLLRSLEAATTVALSQGSLRQDDVAALRPWARRWRRWSAAAFLRGYLPVAESGGFLPTTAVERDVLLELYLLDNALEELRYELAHRPERVSIPLEGILNRLPRA